MGGIPPITNFNTGEFTHI